MPVQRGVRGGMIELACGAVPLACALAVGGFDGWTAAEPDVQAVTPASAARVRVSVATPPRVRPPRRDIDMAPIMPEALRCLVLARRISNVS